MHTYVLGLCLVTLKLVRIPRGYIPENTIKVLRLKSDKCFRYDPDPYDEKGDLKPIFWALRRKL